MLIMSTHEDTKNLHKIRIELMMNASHTQTLAATMQTGYNEAADMLAKAIDQEVLDQLVGKKPTVFDIMEEFDTPMTWKGFVK
jgi:hypothetical protein